jgi:hypothetical protein
MLPNLVSDRSRLPWLECLAAREDEVTASKKGGSGLLLKQFRLSDISAALCDSVLPHDRSRRFFRRRKEPGDAAETMVLGDLSSRQKEPD